MCSFNKYYFSSLYSCLSLFTTHVNAHSHQSLIELQVVLKEMAPLFDVSHIYTHHLTYILCVLYGGLYGYSLLVSFSTHLSAEK